MAVLAVVAVIAGLTFRDYGLGWDDYTHSQYGDLLLSFYGSGLLPTRRALTFVNLYEYGGGFDMAAALAAKPCRSGCSRRGGSSAPQSASSASLLPGGSAAASADRPPDWSRFYLCWQLARSITAICS